LQRGYAVVTGPDGSVVRRADALEPGDPVQVRLAAGRLGAAVTRIEMTEVEES
jgi:exodeoxyribonuclease VII large subunit